MAKSSSLQRVTGRGKTPTNTVEPTNFAGDPDFMNSLARGLAILQAFDVRRRSLTVSQASAATGIPRAASRRCLYTLRRLGFVSEDGGRYCLRPKVLTLGFSHMTSLPLTAAAQPLLDRCRDRLHESCSLGVLDGGNVFYHARAETTRIISIGLFVGSRLPAYCTSMGRVLLAHLPDEQIADYLRTAPLQPRTSRTVTSRSVLNSILNDIRRQGYAAVDQELEMGLRSIAVPVLDRNGGVIAAINAGTQSTRITMKELLQRILPEVRLTAADLRLVL